MQKKIELAGTLDTFTTATSPTGKTFDKGQKTIDVTINVKADKHYINLFHTMLYICLAKKLFNELKKVFPRAEQCYDFC